VQDPSEAHIEAAISKAVEVTEITSMSTGCGKIGAPVSFTLDGQFINE
jgi:hypothetical protein